MDIDTYQYRSKARVVAYGDLILNSMSLCLCLFMFVGLLRVTSTILDTGDGTDIDNDTSSVPIVESTKEVEIRKLDTNDIPNIFIPLASRISNSWLAVCLWIPFVFILGCVSIQIVAAVKLLNSTQIGKDHGTAVKLTRFWRNVAIIFTTFGVLASIGVKQGTFGRLFSSVGVVLKIIGIYFVQKFITELEFGVESDMLARPPGHAHLSPGMAYTYGTPEQGTVVSEKNEDPAPKAFEVIQEKEAYQQQ